MYCPECGSPDTHSEESEQNYRLSDEHSTVIEEYYICQYCGCEFTVRYTTTYKIIIDKHGEETKTYPQSQH